MQNVLIIGAGREGLAILNTLAESGSFGMAGLVDLDRSPDMEGTGPGEIPVYTHWKEAPADSYDVVIEASGHGGVFGELENTLGGRKLLIPGSFAYLIARLFEDKKALIGKLEKESSKHDLIFNTTNDGMIVIDKNGEIILFNRSAERMTEVKREEALGRPVIEIIPDSRLPHTAAVKRTEVNREHVLKNGLKIITTRIPLLDEDGGVLGAVAVFKDISEAVSLAEQITDLKEVQTMLEAIIQSSDDAISVVDEKGHGLLVNPAYTRITGLTNEEVIGKPATADISEGDSVHMHVLKTRRPVRGANMRVGPKRREVIVNVAPIIVDGRLKGSVGVLHDVSEIRRLNEELNRARQLIRTLEAKYTFEDIIGNSEEMKLPVEQARLSAGTPATVLLRGESGTGKELFAHAIHNASSRKYNKFVRVNCAAISESLLESELFGYEEGAFSGAKRGGKRGYFEEANNGSIFLDEIGELSASMQAKLLRVLQENEIVRVGGTKPVHVNVRIIAATNRNLEKAIKDGSFREDLYFRLNRMPIYITPLRKRKEDIGELAGRLIQKINQEYGRNIEGITHEALRKLQEYDWPGNVRELENMLGRAVIFMDHAELYITENHLPDLFEHPLEGEPAKKENPTGTSFTGTLSDRMDHFERQQILEALSAHQFNKTHTARELGISLRSLYYKLEKFNIEGNGLQ